MTSSISDQAQLSEVQQHLVEPTVDGGTTFASGLWTVTEVINYFNQRQYRFLRDTQLLLTRTSLVTTPNVNRQPLPTNWIVTSRAAWQDITNVFTEIPRGDTWEADHAILDWPYNGAQRPQLWTDGETPTLQIELLPSPNVSGTVWLLYVALSALLSNTGQLFTVPDEFVPSIKWGAIADMLSKVGRAFDPVRAEYAESRYEEGVEAAKIMLAGWA